MVQPLAFGRKLPRNDWEGDDFTPGADGHYVTCTDTAVGRCVCWATNGRIDKDGKVYRAAVPGHDPDGINLQQARVAVRRVAGVELVIPAAWGDREARAHLLNGGGLVMQGWYAAMERAYRYQLAAAFGHACWASHLSRTSGIRWYDPLNPDIHAYGRWVPEKAIWPFVEALSRREGYAGLFVAYVPLQHL